jgi:hypothetical protein
MAPQVERQRIPEPVDETDILREQLDYLIDHAGRNPSCGCSECRRYLRARTALLEIFTEPPRSNVRQMAHPLAEAA